MDGTPANAVPFFLRELQAALRSQVRPFARFLISAKNGSDLRTTTAADCQLAPDPETNNLIAFFSFPLLQTNSLPSRTSTFTELRHTPEKWAARENVITQISVDGPVQNMHTKHHSLRIKLLTNVFLNNHNRKHCQHSDKYGRGDVKMCWSGSLRNITRLKHLWISSTDGRFAIITLFNVTQIHIHVSYPELFIVVIAKSLICYTARYRSVHVVKVTNDTGTATYPSNVKHTSQIICFI